MSTMLLILSTWATLFVNVASHVDLLARLSWRDCCSNSLSIMETLATLFVHVASRECLSDVCFCRQCLSLSTMVIYVDISRVLLMLIWATLARIMWRESGVLWRLIQYLGDLGDIVCQCRPLCMSQNVYQLTGCSTMSVLGDIVENLVCCVENLVCCGENLCSDEYHLVQKRAF